MVKGAHKTIGFRSYWNFNDFSLDDQFNVPWINVKQCNNVDDVLQLWQCLFNDVNNKHIPKTNKCVRATTVIRKGSLGISMKISLCTEKGTSYRFFITNFDGNHNISSMYIILHILIKGFLYFGYKAKINGKINLQHHSVQWQSQFSKLRCFPPQVPRSHSHRMCVMMI